MEDLWIDGQYIYCPKYQDRKNPLVCMDKCRYFQKKSCAYTFDMPDDMLEEWTEQYALYKGVKNERSNKGGN